MLRILYSKCSLNEFMNHTQTHRTPVIYILYTIYSYVQHNYDLYAASGNRTNKRICLI